MSSNVKMKKSANKIYRRFSRNKKGMRTVAFSLAAIMVLSIFSANISSIVDLLTAYAADSDAIYYAADLTLYDYYTDSEIKGGGDNNANDGANKNTIFNTALYDSGYATKAADDTHTWSNENLKYFPLYLGLQFPGNNGNNFMKNSSGNKYNYSITANSEANSGTSGAALGLVDSQLSNGVLTQGDATVALPYFDEEFLTSPIGRILSTDSVSSLGVSDYTSKTLGKVSSGYKFNFVKVGNYYIYDSENYGLNYSDKNFTASVSGGTKYNDLYGAPGFFPWRYLGNSSQNFGYAAKFSIPFTMSSDGTIVQMNSDGTTSSGTDPIEFKFKGDDDVWVFIDDQLVLDVGGAHGAVAGNINFKDKTATTENIKTSTMYNQSGNASVGAGTSKDLTTILDNLGLYDDATRQHTLTVYYIERGSLESNCYISFNFQIADSISVANKLDTSKVNSYFLEETKAVAAKEGVEYVIASNSVTSSMSSPDLDRQGESIVQTSELCTVNFDTGGAEYGSYDSYKVVKGTTVVLPSGYNLSRTGWRLKGWSLNSDGSGTLYNSYKVQSPITFYASWEKMPIKEVPEPLLLYVKSSYALDSTGSSMDKYKNVTDNNYIANYTADGSQTFWVKVKVGTENKQHPSNDSGYTFNDPNSTNARNGDHLNLTAGGAYAFVLESGTSSTLYKYTDYSASSFAAIDETNAAGFVAAHFNLYNKLVDARTQLSSSDNPDLLAVYSEALDYYKTVQYSSDAAAKMNQYASDLEANAVAYDHVYSYSSATTKLYIYSETDISGQSVTVTNSHGLSPAAFTISKLSNVPAGATDTSSNYYVAEVPTSIVDTKTPQGGGAAVVANITPQLSFTVGSTTVTTTVDEVKAVSSSYPCYYATKSEWKDITAAWVSYSYSTNKIIWFYGNPGEVTYTSEDGNDVKKVTAKKDIEGYYYVEVPKTVTKTDAEGSTTGNVKLSFNLNGAVSTTVADLVSGKTAPCYFNTGVNTSGWYNLLTVVVNAPSWWSEINVWGAEGTPLEGGTWPTDAIPMVATGNSGYYYYYLPQSTNVFVFMADKTNVASSGVTYQSADVCFYDGNKDTLFDGAGNADPYSKVTYSNTKYIAETTSGSADSTYYALTATRKATTLLSSYVQTSALSVLSVDDVLDDVTNDDSTVADEENSTENQTNEAADEALSVSGAGVGQFNNDGTKYAYATATNFKLYDNYFSEVTGGAQEFLVRQTNTSGNGEFNLMFDQRARFTYQFRRFSGIKIAQTGTSYKFTSADDIHNGNTVIAAADTPKYGQASTDKALYNRYSTKWVVEDEDGGKITSSRENYNVHPIATSEVTNGDNTSIVTKSTNNSLYLDNIIKEADTNTGIHLTATFTNTVLTGDLTITKTLTANAIEAIRDYRAEHSDYDPEFAFRISFSNVFGGDSASAVYDGTYYINGTTESTAYQTVGGVNNCIVMKYSDLYDDDGNSKNYSVVIKGVPVQTDYAVREVIVNNENEPSLNLQSVTQSVLTNETSLTPDENKTVTGEITAASSETGVETDTNLQTGAIAQYYTAVTGSSDFSVEFVNDIDSAYLIITKMINELYYGPNDNPAGLLGSEAVVGGVTLTEAEKMLDPNGYEAATNAEQTFIFKITEYAGMDGNGSLTGKTGEFYETISFPKGSVLSKSKIVKVDPTKYYTVEEVVDWSWKYTLDNTTVTKNGINGNGVSDKVATVHNFAEQATFNSTTYNRTDTVTFTNSKKTDNTEDVEGDTSIMINIIRKVS
ncbi:MAG: fibro-slime domain-containing protein [Acutalibacteraceae bacterium]